MTPTQPKPSRRLVVASVVVILAAEFVLAAILAVSITDHDNFFAMGGAVLLLSPVALVAIKQFRGTFRYEASAAKTAANFLMGFSLLLMVAYFAITGEGLMQTQAIGFYAVALSPLLLVGLLFFLSSRWNRVWSHELRNSEARAREFGRPDVMFLAASGAAIAIASFCLVTTTPPRFAVEQTAENVSFDTPDGARRIAHARTANGSFAFECETDEESFRRWVAGGIGSWESNASGTKLEEISEEFSIPTYRNLLPDGRLAHETVIRHGLVYNWLKGDRCVEAVYDRESGKAYYYCASR